MGWGLPAFVDKVPDYVVKDGRMYISMEDFCLAMPIRVFEIGCLRGSEAIAKWQVDRLDEGKVVPFSLSAGS